MAGRLGVCPSLLPSGQSASRSLAVAQRGRHCSRRCAPVQGQKRGIPAAGPPSDALGAWLALTTARSGPKSCFIDSEALNSVTSASHPSGHCNSVVPMPIRATPAPTLAANSTAVLPADEPEASPAALGAAVDSLLAAARSWECRAGARAAAAATRAEATRSINAGPGPGRRGPRSAGGCGPGGGRRTPAGERPARRGSAAAERRGRPRVAPGAT